MLELAPAVSAVFLCAPWRLRQLFNNIHCVSSMDWIYTVPASPDLSIIAAAFKVDPNLQRK